MHIIRGTLEQAKMRSAALMMRKMIIILPRYERRGINIRDDLNKTFKDPEYGISSIRAGGLMFLLCALSGYSSFCLLTSLIKNSLPGELIFVLVIPFGIFNFYILFYKDKMLTLKYLTANLLFGKKSGDGSALE